MLVIQVKSVLTCVVGVGGMEGVVVGEGRRRCGLWTPEHLTHTGSHTHHLHGILHKREEESKWLVK